MLTFISKALYPFFEKLLGRHFPKEGFLKYTHTAQWIAISRISTMIFSLVTTLLVARIIGPETFGVFNYVLSIVALFGILASLGVENVVYKEITKNKEDRLEILGSAIALRLATGALCVLLIACITFFLHESYYVKKLIFILSLSLVTQSFFILSYDFLKDSEAKYVTITQVITMFVSNILKLCVIYFYGSLTLFIIILVLENVFSGLLYAFQIKMIKKRSINFVIKKKYIFVLLYLSIPLTLYSGFYEIYSRIDQIMLRHYLDIKAVGLYSAAVRLTEIWYIIPNILMGTFFPAFIHAENNTKEYNKRLKIFFLLLTVLSLLVSLSTLLLGKFFVRIVYGESFIAATPILSIYIFSLFGSFLSFIIYQDLFIRKKLYGIVLIPLFTALLNIGLNIILIPAKGAAGAAFATVVSYSIIPLVYYVIYRHKN